jgi:hypothetical protein
VNFTAYCVLKHLRKPRRYERSEEEWRKEIKDALTYESDWIEVLVERGLGQPLNAAVSEMASRLDVAELHRYDT